MLTVSTARRLITESRPERLPDGYPPAVRAGVTALARALVEDGQSVCRVAGELGLHRGTLARWLREDGPMGPGFVALSVPELPRGAGLVLVSPGGYRLEGLDLESAVYALSRLG